MVSPWDNTRSQDRVGDIRKCLWSEVQSTSYVPVYVHVRLFRQVSSKAVWAVLAQSPASYINIPDRLTQQLAPRPSFLLQEPYRLKPKKFGSDHSRWHFLDPQAEIRSYQHDLVASVAPNH